MGRKTNKNLPPRMRARQRREKTWYYYDMGGTPRREVPLGNDYVVALQRWAELEGDVHKPVFSFADAASRYMRDVSPSKSEGTQACNKRELATLLMFFNDPPAPLDEIEPKHIRQYLRWRVEYTKQRDKESGRVPRGDGSVRANREKALFSHIWNYARAEGLTNKPNPCAGISGHKELPRDVYVDDAEFKAVYDQADQVLRDAMDLALLTGQREADVFKLDETHIKDGCLWIRQNKTRAKLRVVIEGELANVIERIMLRKRSYKVRSLRLLVTEDGQPMTYNMFRSRFDKAREAAGGVKWQFRDLRAKAGTDADDRAGTRAAQELLAHSDPQTTQTYIRHRVGKKVKPAR